MTEEFLESIEHLRDELAGTEHVCYLLYSIIRMSKPKNVLEFGVGYTTPFILQAIRENMRNFNEITNKLKVGCYDGYMRNLNFSYYQSVPQYTYTGVDNMSHEDSNFAIEYIKKQNDITVDLHLDNYNTLSKDKKYDLVIYGSIKRGMPFFDIVSQNYDKKNIILLFGEDKMDHKFPRNFTSRGYNVFVREQS
jgi:hypothetical protein